MAFVNVLNEQGISFVNRDLLTNINRMKVGI